MNPSQQNPVIQKRALFFKWYLIVLLFLFGLFFTVVFTLDLLRDPDPVSDHAYETVVQDSVRSPVIPAAADTSSGTKIILLILAGILPLGISVLLLFMTIRKTGVRKVTEEVLPSANSVLSDQTQ